MLQTQFSIKKTLHPNFFFFFLIPTIRGKTSTATVIFYTYEHTPAAFSRPWKSCKRNTEEVIASSRLNKRRLSQRSHRTNPFLAACTHLAPRRVSADLLA